MVARAIKSRWYEAVTSRQDQQRPIAVIADEYQRFITADPASGDANFLDIARAYRCNCTFATQSIGALEIALGSGRHAASAIRSILTNTPSKFFFASQDAGTVEAIKGLIPGPPIAGPHVVDARPPSRLKPGEAYWTLANGTSGRGRALLTDLL